MMTQTEMFEKSEIDDAQLVLAKLQGDWEKADKAVAAAEDKRDYIRFLVGKQEHVIERLKVNTTITFNAPAEAMAVDGETGEVVDDEPEETEPEPFVYAFRPGSGKPVGTPVGERTRFGELVADYISETGGDQDLAEYRVTGDDGIPRPLNSIISPDDYGLEFFIEPALATEIAS